MFVKNNNILVNTVYIENIQEQVEKEQIKNIGEISNPENIAVIYYTSGSTGKPKGVKYQYNAIARKPVVPIAKNHKYLLRGISLRVIYWLLEFECQGILVEQEKNSDSEHIVNLIVNYNVTTAVIPPSLLRIIIDESGFQNCYSLNHIFSGGEKLNKDLQERFLNQSNALLHHTYGLTETGNAAISTYQRRNIQNPISIGCSVPDTEIYLLNSNMEIVPFGEIGEMFIAGRGVAKGYLNRPELTAERFLPDPFSTEQNSKLFKTGDLARYLPNGEIEFLGRIDHQINIRGYRIEPHEIESALNQHASVQQSVIAAKEYQQDDKRLVAYVVFKQGQFAAPYELRRVLKEKLPEHMVPSAFVILDILPLTPSGKVDRRALPAPDTARRELDTEFIPPRTPVEEVVAGVWKRILDVEQVGVHDNFFELGGHSLSAAEVVFRLRELFRMELPLQALFQEPTVDGLVGAIAQLRGGREIVEEIVQVIQEIENLSEDEVKAMRSQAG